MLKHLGITSLRLMTNNPRKVDSLRLDGVEITDRVPLTTGLNAFNQGYLATKAAKLGHRFDLDDFTLADPANADSARPEHPQRPE